MMTPSLPSRLAGVLHGSGSSRHTSTWAPVRRPALPGCYAPPQPCQGNVPACEVKARILRNPAVTFEEKILFLRTAWLWPLDLVYYP